MSQNSVTPSEFFNPFTQVAQLKLIACPGAEELTRLIDDHLKVPVPVSRAATQRVW